MYPWIIAVTGASGTVYARRLIAVLLKEIPEVELEVVFSEPALRVMREEEGLKVSPNTLKIAEVLELDTPRVRIHNNRDIGASIASGSYPTSGMVVVPCSMSSLAAIAHGYAENLIHRAADVVIKERRKLILVPRETPLSEIHLRNMLDLVRLGAQMVPAMPGFYHQPKTIDDIVEMMVMRIIDQMGLRVEIASRWKIPQSEHSQWPVQLTKKQNERSS